MLPGGTLADRVALVTGGGSGLGRAMALELGRLGATVAVLGRRREPLEETVELLGAGCAVPADVREPEGVAAAFDAAEEQLGPITTLVNNAAATSTCRRRTCHRMDGAQSSVSSSTGRFTARVSSGDG